MRLKMLKLAAGPGGVYRVGKIVDIDRDEALAFIASGAAVPEREDVIETAMAPPPPEAMKRGKREDRNIHRADG